MSIRPIIIVFFLSSLFYSCEFTESDIQYNLGNDFINDPSTVIMIDTMTVNTYTTTIDSFVTSQADRFLVGDAKDPYDIETYCESYMRFGLATTSSFHETAKFDSIRLVLHLDGYNYGDTSTVGNFGIYRLTDDLEVNSETSYMYNTTSFASETSPMGTFQIDYNKEDNVISVPIGQAFGQELFNRVIDEGDTVNDKDLFVDYFKGIVIKPLDGQTNFVAGIFGIVDSVSAPRIRIYYHDITINDDLYFDFPIEKVETTSGYINYRSFNHIENNYEGTVLEGIESESSEAKLSSMNTDNVSFMQSGSVLRTRIELPTIDNLYALGIGSIVKAELEFEPIRALYNQESDLPSKLEMTIVDAKNREYNPLYVAGTSDAAYGYLNYNDEFKSQTNYTYDITNFVKTEYEDKSIPENSLMMSINYGTQLPFSKYPNLNPLIIGNRKNVDYKMKLKVYITNY